MKVLKNDGFTLIEILAAIAILSIGVISVLGLFPLTIQNSKVSTEVSQASLYGQEQVERLLTSGFKYVVENTADAGVYADSGADEEIYEWEYRTVPNSPTIDDDVVFVSLGVYWPANAGDPYNRDYQQRVMFTTYITDYVKRS